ncbi:SDR family oxidoreductase [Pseudomonas sp. SL4(2022)]|uniref:SDR family oxidoreductase n=1 Tax=Pseudomonas sp. SL4(2022) TaxID=2994661 RepID=UPI00226FF34F|nr:SDR family oxidoreductase [Pseudomonas sp. SL4(2022)]WAC43287.1 SDR family oxidoreductase [Pseudomonas sp. SL4(2022)]
MNQSCFVTGGSGFIGQHLLALLTHRGHPVSVLMRRPHSLPALREQIEQLGGRGDLLTAVAGDLGLPGLGLDAAAREQVRQAAVVFHLGVQFAWGLSLAQARQVNVEGAIQVAELAAQQGSRLLMVGGFMLANHAHLQRIGVDLQHPERTNWDRLYRRSGAYEGSKLEAHFRVRARMAELQVPLTLVHPATVCGHSRSGHILPAQPLAGLIDNLAAGRLGAIPGSAAHWLPLVSVDFLAELLVAAAFDEQQIGQEILALDAATPNLQGMLQQLAHALSVRAPSRHLPIPLLRGVLKLPGVPGLLHTDVESLDFIQTTRFDTAATQALARRHQLHWPDIGQALQATARYLVRTPSVA